MFSGYRIISTTAVVRSQLQRFTTSSMSEQCKPIVISGPSGSGKSTLLNKLFAEYPGYFAFSVSHTTRSPRPGEENGVAYHFVTKDDFQNLIADDGFLEHAQFGGNCYGTSKKSVTDITESGKICVLDVEINGVKAIKKVSMSPAPRFMFIKPPSVEELEKRLKGRGTETEESLKKRMATVQEAVDYAEQPGSYDHIIINDKLETAYTELKNILSKDLQTIKQLKGGE